jgi:hypothetical protein
MDLSTGYDKRNHNFEITERKIDKALVPQRPDYQGKGWAAIIEATVYVTALPDMFASSYQTMYDAVEGVTEAVIY